MSSIEDTLQERETRYGEFHNQAAIAQGIKTVMQQTLNWALLSADKRECLDMIANKVARILNGDPEYHDSWHDIIGYTKLVADRILERESLAEVVRRANATPLPIHTQALIDHTQASDEAVS